MVLPPYWSRAAAPPPHLPGCAREGQQGQGGGGGPRRSALLFAAAREGGDPPVPEPAGPCGAWLGVAGEQTAGQTVRQALVRCRAPLRQHVEELARTEFDNEAVAQPCRGPRASEVSLIPAERAHTAPLCPSCL